MDSTHYNHESSSFTDYILMKSKDLREAICMGKKLCRNGRKNNKSLENKISRMFYCNVQL